MKLRQQLDEAEKEIERLTTNSSNEAERAAVLLNEVQSSWEEKPERSFLIVGQAVNKKSKEPTHIDKVFAMRMGINVTHLKRLNVRYAGRAHVNNVFVEITDYDNRMCRLAFKTGNRQNTRGEWCAVSVSNVHKKWYDCEERLYPDWKSQREPIEYWLNAYKEINGALLTAKTTDFIIDSMHKADKKEAEKKLAEGG